MSRCYAAHGLSKPASACSTADMDYSPHWKRQPPRSSAALIKSKKISESRRSDFVPTGPISCRRPAQYAAIVSPNDAVAFARGLLQALAIEAGDATALVIDGAGRLERT